MAHLVEYVNIFNIPTTISNNLNVLYNTNLSTTNINNNLNISGNLNIKQNIIISNSSLNTIISHNEIISYDFKQKYNIIAFNGKYLLNMVSNPILYLIKGNTYIFDLDNITTDGHPFYITASSIGGTNANLLKYDTGVSNNGSHYSTSVKQVIFTVPDDAPNNLYYHCGIHSDMGNKIHIISSDIDKYNNYSISNNISVAGNATINDQLIVANDVNMNNNISVAGNATINDQLIVANDAIMNSNISVAGNATINDQLIVANDAIMNSNINIKKDLLETIISHNEIISYDFKQKYNIIVFNGKYLLNMVSNPILYLIKGNTYIFDLDNITTDGHPFYITTSSVGGTNANLLKYDTGVSNNGSHYSTSAKKVIFTVPDDAPDNLYYHCGIHSDMGNIIHIIGNNSSNSSNASNASGDFIIQKNLNVSGNAIFNSGISLGSSILNPAVNKNGTIRYTGNDIEGYINGAWKSLTSGGSGSNNITSHNNAGCLFSTNTFQISNITDTYKLLNNLIGFTFENNNINNAFKNTYQMINNIITLYNIEIYVSHNNLPTDNLSFNLKILIDNSTVDTVNIIIPQNSTEAVFISLTNPLVIENNKKLQLELKANDITSKTGDLFVILHGESNTVSGNLSVQNNLTVSGNGNFNDKINVKDLFVSNEVDINKNLIVSGNGNFNDKINVKDLFVSNEVDINKNLTVSANCIFKSGIILGNSNINPAFTELGTIRYSGLDIEGYLDGTWKSLTSGGSGGGSSKSNTFQLNNITQTATYLKSIIGFSIHNSTLISRVFGNNYQIINSANSFDTLEINISHPNLSTNPLSYSLEIYIDNNLSQTINITIPQNSTETILRTITNLVVQPNNKLQLKIKALDSASEGGDIFISLHNINTTIPTPVENRITSGLINSDVFQLNSITQSYNNLETMIGFNLENTTISEICIKDYQIITNPNIYNILEVNLVHNNIITNSLSYNLEIYINNNVAQTVNINIPQNSIQTVLVSISELEVKQNDKLQLKIKANDVISEGGNIFISLHGKNIITTTTTSIQDNFSIGHNLTVSGNGIFNDTINVGELAISNKIGIGTSIVETSLDVDSSLKIFDILNDVSGYVNTSSGNYMKLQATSRTDTSTKKNIVLNPDGGNIGIGTTNPQFKLDIDGIVYSSNGFYTPPYSSSGNYYFGTNYPELNRILAGMEIEHTTLNGNYSQKVHFRTHHYATNENIRMTIDEVGYVGIGVTNPTYRLHVIGGSSSAVINVPYINSVGGIGGATSHGGSSVGIYANKSIGTGVNFLLSSDERIKTNIVELVDNEALLKFRQLKPCKYNYIDTVERGSDEVYGFIAQEVKSVISNAVFTAPNAEMIPNIYKLALYNNNIITFDTVHNLDSDGNIKLILPDNKKITVPYTIVDTLKINIDTSNLSDEEKPSNDLVQGDDGNNLAHNIFVYGTEVDDFHTLNKDAIWTTAAAALQEVDRIQQADAVKIQTLENTVSTLETKNTELETEVSTLKTQLADLLVRVSALENN